MSPYQYERSYGFKPGEKLGDLDEFARRIKVRRIVSMLVQKLIGIVVLAICALIVWYVVANCDSGDRDCTAVMVIAPAGLWMVFTKHRFLWL